ncbi:RCC1 domain-containing protein [Polyangium mundeleinium]|uniref:RCC1-like domain-containing protein n=1 Tax=Polyangium mundeleinium TaxID=2995306 RepID=A0ABT5F150_9BACT|nr:hypothetical protein [Polyangium mundeleinium]MDC0747780.1 hypothetical protein [Polyangium mundeleinium]
MACVPFAQVSCYTGPADTEGVGVCASGLQPCDERGQPVGACIGQTTPMAEQCDTEGRDEDCDGQINEPDAHCCGDGVLAFGETCDDGNADPTDACTPLCMPPFCGDGFVQGALGEQCDGGPLCSPWCRHRKIVSAASNNITCAVLPDGKARCWGSASGGGLGSEDNYESLGDEFGEMGHKLRAVKLGEGARVVEVGNGNGYGCALLDDGRIKCWGNNTMGCLGLGHGKSVGGKPGEMGDELPPVDLGTGAKAISIAVGFTHNCALLADGRVKCWGENTAGALGLGDWEARGDDPGEMGDALPAVDLGADVKVLTITVGKYHSCVLLMDGRVKCWGSGSHGQLGTGDMEARGDDPGEMGDAVPAIDLGTHVKATALASAGAHSCALLDDGRVKCWGGNYDGALGLGDLLDRGDEPGEMGDALPAVDLGAGAKATAIAAGGANSCAVLDDGRVKCWGYNGHGKLGLGDTKARGDGPGEMGDNLPPVDLGTGAVAVTIVPGLYHACVILQEGRIKCWGSNGFGALGLGDIESRGDEPGEMGDALPLVNLGASSW